MVNLLDVNVLLALFDGTHDHHRAAHAWMEAHASERWASCAITEKGFVRIACSPSYPNLSLTPQEAVVALRAFQARSKDQHVFLVCDVSFADATLFDLTPLASGRHTTDAYLVGLAFRHGARLVTFDASVPWQTVKGGGSDLVQRIDPGS